ncbi:SDR family NAD(P)-dependent oxidoreductase [Paractinoplanes toevensis]|uniref:Short-chain dehydrogenase n=1 Tax=Paractinoplanes toevensis TaxID=571911 RepID=A0A919T905_9ACTN|nr:SDR family NAD(P)-dependent oxidoreductase [Actinoplanes toevensis]GIM89909.1 short-chain dehydrogenase [Actinoplanes toevensis]
METPTAVITGATSGLGELAAIDLARRGFSLVLLARSAERADATVARIEEAAPGGATEVVLADLTDLDQVRRAGEQIANGYARIDVLINNAGLHAFAPRTTRAGLPEMMVVNYLAPWVLTSVLRSTLIASAPARVVTVASEASRRHGVLTLPDDLTDTAPFNARQSSAIYGRTKLLDIMFSAELARRLSGTGVTANALDPGFNVTGLGRELRFAAALEKVLRSLRVGDPRRGTSGIVRLATDPALAACTGGYFSARTGKQLTPVPPGADPAEQRRLWELTEQLVGVPHVG